MAQSASRRQRRQYEKYLKKTNPSVYRQWKSQSQERGQKLFNEHKENTLKEQETYLENLQTQVITSLKLAGKSDSEIDRYVEIWVKTIKLWGQPESGMRWHDAVKECDLENAK